MNKLIKSYICRRYKIELYETPEGKYMIQYDNFIHDLQQSEEMDDYKMASYMFDMKCQELDGH